MKENDALLLNGEQRKRLRGILKKSDDFLINPSNVPLQIAILKALEQIGTREDVPIVTKIAESTGRKYTTKVRKAARVCLPYLTD